MGSLDQPAGTQVQREIRVFDVGGKTAQQIEDAYNNNFGKIGWRIIQIVVISGKPFIVCEREL